jgi:hypothetical protein
MTIIAKLSSLNLSNRSNVNEITPIDHVASWNQKPLQRRFANSLSNADKSSTNWLESGSLHAETGGFIFAIHDQVIATKNYQKFIEKLDIMINAEFVIGNQKLFITSLQAALYSQIPNTYTGTTSQQKLFTSS